MYNVAVESCNQNATYILQLQERIDFLENRGNTLLTKYMDRVNDQKERIEQLEQDLESEKLINNFINSYMLPNDNSSMEFLEKNFKI